MKLKRTDSVPKPTPKKSGANQPLAKPPVVQPPQPVVREKPWNDVTPPEPGVVSSPLPERVTTIEVAIDVGFGNSLFIRGEGAGLSWQKSLPLTCVGDSTWVWSTNQAQEKLLFKLLLNDLVWCQGEDLTAEVGQKTTVVPVFQ